MRPGRPKQHTHNWQMKFTKFEWESRVTPYSPGGFNSKRYWACIRGGKIKHTEKWIDRLNIGFDGEPILISEHVFIQASGFSFYPVEG